MKTSKEKMEKSEAHNQLKNLGEKLDQLGVFPKEDGRTTGNLSIRDESGFWLTTTGSDKANLNPSDLVKIDERGDPSSEGVPSREHLIHAAVYARDPAAATVAHYHDRLALEFPDPTDPTVPFLVGASAVEGHSIALAMEGNPYLHIESHGQVVKGTSPKEVATLARKKHGEARKKWHWAMSPTYALAASALLGVGEMVRSDYERFQGCQMEHGLGTVTYTCPTDRSPFQPKTWEGEQYAKNPDGSVTYIFWIGGQ